MSLVNARIFFTYRKDEDMPLKVVIITASLVVGAVGGYFLIEFLRDACVVPSIKLSEEKSNNEGLVVKQAMSLIKEAEIEIEIFDDGNPSDNPESLYNSDVFIEAVQSKIKDNPDFRVRVLFNEGHSGLKFIREFRNRSDGCVALYVRKDGNRPPDRHYKIIDRGMKGVLSRHDYGDPDRTYQELSIERRKKSDMLRAGRNAMRLYGQPIKRFRRMEAA